MNGPPSPISERSRAGPRSGKPSAGSEDPLFPGVAIPGTCYSRNLLSPDWAVC